MEHFVKFSPNNFKIKFFSWTLMSLSFMTTPYFLSHHPTSWNSVTYGYSWLSFIFFLVSLCYPLRPLCTFFLIIWQAEIRWFLRILLTLFHINTSCFQEVTSHCKIQSYKFKTFMSKTMLRLYTCIQRSFKMLKLNLLFFYFITLFYVQRVNIHERSFNF